MTNGNQKQFYRVHRMLDANRAVKTNIATNGLGESITVPNGAGQIVPLYEAMQCGCPVLDEKGNQISYQQNQNTAMVGNNNLPFAVLPAEGAAGKPGVVRLESPQPQANQQTWWISLINTDDEADTVLIFDGFGLAAAKLGIAAPKVTTLVNGTFGAQTLAQFKLQTAAMAFDLHYMHFAGTDDAGALSDAIFQSGSFSGLQSSPNNNTLQQNEIVVRNLLLPSSFQPAVRIDPDYRSLVNGYSAILVTLPAETGITLTWNISGFSNAAPVQLYR